MINTQTTGISPDVVQDALDRLIYSSAGPRTPSPLISMALVDDFIDQLPPTVHVDNQYLRDYALQQVLSDAIHTALAHLRRIRGLPPPQAATPLTDEIRLIAADSGAQAAVLLAWSFLYYRYVRVDLDLSPLDYAQYAGHTDRSLRRYRQHGVDLLTRYLINAEIRVHQRRHRARMYAALPMPDVRHLVGREQVLAQALRALHKRYDTHFIVSGAPGSGKTAFVCALLHHYIADGAPLTSMIWAATPRNTEEVYHQICDHLRLRPDPLRLREYFLSHQVAIVIDDVSHLPTDHLIPLLERLTGALVILVSPAQLTLNTDVQPLLMRDLRRDEIAQLVAQAEVADAVADEITTVIQHQVGGNPYAVRLAIRDLLSDDNTDITSFNPLPRLFQHQFDRSGAEARLVWCACAIGPASGVVADALLTLFPGVSAGLAQLIEGHILRMARQGMVILSSSAQRYIRMAAEETETVRSLITDILQTLTVAAHQQPTAALPFIEQILYSQWPVIPAEVARAWFEALLQQYQIIPYRIYTLLSHLYRTDAELSTTALLSYGREARRRGDWQQAAKVFTQIITYAGKSGQFPQQAEAFFQFGVLLMQSGQYDRALQVFNQAEKIASRFLNQSLLIALQVEYAQIAVDLHQPAQAFQYLTTLPRSQRVLALYAEACLLNGQLQDGIAAANDALHHHHRDPVNISRMQVLIGRLYRAQGDKLLARRYFEAAINALTSQHDPFGLARAQANLGALMIEMGLLDEAETWLRAAQSLQSLIGDYLGETFTRQAFALLDQARMR